MDFIVRYHVPFLPNRARGARHKAQGANSSRCLSHARLVPARSINTVGMFLLTPSTYTDLSRSFLRGPRPDLDPLYTAVAHILSHVLPVRNATIRRHLEELVLFLQLMGAQVAGPGQRPAASALLAVRITTHEPANAERLLQPVLWHRAQR